MPSRYRFSAQIIGNISLVWGARACALRRAIRRGFGGQHLTKRRQAALVAALACVSLLAVTLATDTAEARGSKSSSAATKSAGKTAKASGKKQSASKSKNK